jgi:hypothetical protein
MVTSVNHFKSEGSTSDLPLELEQQLSIFFVQI